MNRRVLIVLAVTCVIAAPAVLFNRFRHSASDAFPVIRPAATPTPTPVPTPPPLPPRILLENGGYHVFQTFNNCGPASLSMTLSYYGISATQRELGAVLRPYQNPGGDNDDKSVTLGELAEYSKEFGLVPYHRPGGTAEIIRRFVANGMPVLTRTLTKPSEDIGHFRVIKGYDDVTGEYVQDDSLQGKNLRYAYEDFSRLWEPFGFEFLVLVPEEKTGTAGAILGELADERSAWSLAARHAEDRVTDIPGNAYAGFTLSVALYRTGDYEGSVRAYESVRDALPMRTLWYQHEPIMAYYELGRYETVFAITDSIFSGGNRAASELYVIRGNAYRAMGNRDAARREYESAVRYNSRLKNARDALESIAGGS